MDRFEHGGDIYSKKVRLDFSANINPLGMPQGAKRSIRNAAALCCTYPDPYCRELTETISEKESISREKILCGNGADDLIFRTVYGAKPKKAMLVTPCFGEYERALSAADCEIVYYGLSQDNDFALCEDILAALDGGYDMIFLCTPNNPTGRRIDTALLYKITDRCVKLGIIPVIDVSFDDFADFPLNRAELAQKGAAVIRSLTKIYALAGIRLGYMLCSDETLLEKIRLSGQSWSVNTPAQAAGIAAMNDPDFIARTVEYVSRERRFLTERLSEAGIRVFPSDANFLLLFSGSDLCAVAEKEGIALRPCDNFRGLGKGYFRAAVRTHEENTELVGALKRGLENG